MRKLARLLDERLGVRLTGRQLRIGAQLVGHHPAFLGRLVCRRLNRIYHRRGYRVGFNADGIDVFAQDWDNLLILDACRYDMLPEAPFGGTVEPVRSRGSDTYEFLRASCPGHDLSDTVYVTASPILEWFAETIDHDFHDVIHVWREDGWDETNRTVLPETVTEHALEATARYPHKRLFVHYLQPHYPFVDSGTTFDKRQFHSAEFEPSFWRMVETGMVEVPRERIWELYQDNLQRALPHVERLVDELDGKTVVSADHGNMVGEQSAPIPITEWGHPPGTYTDELVTVPWIECPYDERRHVVRGDGASTGDDRDREETARRLEALGYLT